ncbi:MAG: acyltransferase [Acidithiobacillus sp.]
MIEKYCSIGTDCIIAWDVFISDSDWHNIVGSERNDPVFIGDDVWIAHGVSITKGSMVPKGSVVGAKSLVLRGHFPEKSLIAGIPATVRRTGVEWSR